jgi:hypothetical protein
LDDSESEKVEIEYLSKLRQLGADPQKPDALTERKLRRSRKRYDFVLQEKGLETLIKPVGLLKSHTNYFESKDVANFILKKVHKKRLNHTL